MPAVDVSPHPRAAPDRRLLLHVPVVRPRAQVFVDLLEAVLVDLRDERVARALGLDRRPVDQTLEQPERLRVRVQLGARERCVDGEDDLVRLDLAQIRPRLHDLFLGLLGQTDDHQRAPEQLLLVQELGRLPAVLGRDLLLHQLELPIRS